MDRIHLNIAALFLVLIGWAHGPTSLRVDPFQSWNAQDTGSISGTVILEGNRLPVGSAKVYLHSTRQLEITAYDGSFRIPNVAVGEHRVLATWKFRWGNVRDVTVKVDQDTQVQIVIPEKTPGMTDEAAAAESIGVDVNLHEKEITCELVPAKEQFHVGDQPQFYVKLRNNGENLITLVPIREWSEDGIKFPRSLLSVRGPASVSDERLFGRCGTENGLLAEHFVEIGPGETFNPRGADTTIHLRDRHAQFRSPGRYEFTYEYSTDEGDVRYWLANGQNRVLDDTSEMFRRVPRFTARCSLVVDVLE